MKTMMIKVLLTTSLIASNCFALDTVPLTLGQAAPFTGVLMSSSKAQVVKVQLLERDTLLQEKDSYEKTIKLYGDIESLKREQVDTLTVENERLSKQLGSASTTSNWERALYFGLGVVGTGLILWATRQTLR